MSNILAEKVHSIHVYSNGYQIQEIGSDDFRIDATHIEPQIPVGFSPEELEDSWVCIRPSYLSSSFYIRYFEKTSKGMLVPEQVTHNLKGYME